MDRRLAFIIGGIIVVILIIIALILVFAVNPAGTGRGETGEAPTEAERLRNNTIKLAADYLERGEYQRALDLLDRLLIENADDEDAGALRDRIIEAKKDSESAQRERDKVQQDSLKDTIAESTEASPLTIYAVFGSRLTAFLYAASDSGSFPWVLKISAAS